MLPYRTVDDRIAGAVLTFVDVTARKRAEDANAADLADTVLLGDLAARLVTPAAVPEVVLVASTISPCLTGRSAGPRTTRPGQCRCGATACWPV